MGQTTYNTLTAAIFLFVAVLHLLRLIFGWTAPIGGLNVPLWASGLALVVSGTLAYFGFRQSARGGPAS